MLIKLFGLEFWIIKWVHHRGKQGQSSASDYDPRVGLKGSFKCTLTLNNTVQAPLYRYQIENDSTISIFQCMY